MKQLTAIITALVILFSFSPAAWAAEDDAQVSESMFVVQSVNPVDSVLSVVGEPLASPDVPDGGVINPEGSTVSENSEGFVLNINDGTVNTNNGTVEVNNGTVETNNGIVETNNGTVETNAEAGSVSENNGTVKTNNGFVNNITGTIENNNNCVENGGTVTVNSGSVYNGILGEDQPTVIFNSGEVNYCETPDEVKYNAGEVYIDYADGDSFERVTYYGVVYANESGEGSLLPQALNEQLLENSADAESILTGLVSSGDLVFTAAVSDSGNSAKNGIIKLLTEAEISFKKAGCTLGGWLDANNNNAAYSVGQTVNVTAPLWLIPDWVLIPVPTVADVPENAGPQQAEIISAPVYIVPAASPKTNSKKLKSFEITVAPSDPRVTKEEELPVAALRLSAELAEILNDLKLQIEFDGEMLASDCFSLTFHDDGTVTLLFSSTFLSTITEGEHEITLFLKDEEIDLTVLFTDPMSEDTSLRAGKDQLSAAITSNPQSSASSQKGKSG